MSLRKSLNATSQRNNQYNSQQPLMDAQNMSSGVRQLPLLPDTMKALPRVFEDYGGSGAVLQRKEMGATRRYRDLRGLYDTPVEPARGSPD